MVSGNISLDPRLAKSLALERRFALSRGGQCTYASGTDMMANPAQPAVHRLDEIPPRGGDRAVNRRHQRIRVRTY